MIIKYFGRICWAVAGTFCEGKVQGTFAQKYADCRKCDVRGELSVSVAALSAPVLVGNPGPAS